MTYFALSFADDDGHRGTCFVEGSDLIVAVRAAHIYGVNPGGQVLGFPSETMTTEDLAALGYEPNRLYSKEEMEAIEEAHGGRAMNTQDMIEMGVLGDDEGGEARGQGRAGR